MRKIFEWVGKIPHLFGKLIVMWCIAVGTGASYWALRILSRTGHDSSPVLAVILGFFGGELLVLCLNTILKEKKSKNVSDQDTEEER